MEGEDRASVIVRDMPHSLADIGSLDDIVKRSIFGIEALFRGRGRERGRS